MIAPRVVRERRDDYTRVSSKERLRSMNSTSPKTSPGAADVHCTLHMRKSGMKSVRRSEKLSNRRADQTSTFGRKQSMRLQKSPMLDVRKRWTAVNNNGCTPGIVEVTETVMGGNTTCGRVGCVCSQYRSPGFVCPVVPEKVLLSFVQRREHGPEWLHIPCLGKVANDARELLGGAVRNSARWSPRTIPPVRCNFCVRYLI